MANATVRIEGLDKLMKKVNSIEGLEVVKAGLVGAAEHVKGKIATYPPPTDANVKGPYPKRWYYRGIGPFWARVDGSFGMRKTSKDLGQKWTIKTRDAGLTAIVGNNVHYGPFVQDEEHQASFHRDHGWKTTQTVAQEETKEVTDLLIKAINQALDK